MLVDLNYNFAEKDCAGLVMFCEAKIRCLQKCLLSLRRVHLEVVVDPV